jgi:UDP-N-acetyl-D-glucosamine dehydrogenase
MPRYAVSKVQDSLNTHQKALNGSKVLVIGVAYKPNIDDLRESPALDIIHLLNQKGAKVSYHDPYITTIHHEEINMQSVPDLDRAVKDADCVVIVTNHSCYDYQKILTEAQLIVDTRNALKLQGQKNDKVVRL